MEHLTEVRKQLDRISPSFCAAKWLQVTLRLHIGHNHSCHHPKTHLIPLDEIAKDPSALHNTDCKKQLRKMMLGGQRPEECHYCWAVEDLGKGHVSDRVIKSGDTWANPHIDKIASAPWNQSVHPTYLEVSFSSSCNFKCSYCSPEVSTKWMEEIRAHGAYPTSDNFNALDGLKIEGRMPIDEKENPYIEAFWKWWPDLYPSLETFRITGGEPLLSVQTFRVLDYINEHPRSELSLAINSNLGVPSHLVDKMLDQVGDLLARESIKDFMLYASLDGWGKPAEYMRCGLDLPTFRRHVEKALEAIPSLSLTFMCTFNALSLTSFKDFLGFLLDLKRRYGNRVLADFSHLVNPFHQNVRVLTADYDRYMDEILVFLRNNPGDRRGEPGFIDYEVRKMERIASYMRERTILESTIECMRSDFYRFFSEHDRRRNTNFLATFPEMETFWKFTKGISERLPAHGKS